MDIAIKTRSVLCLEVSKTIKSNQELLCKWGFVVKKQVLKSCHYEYANYMSGTLIVRLTTKIAFNSQHLLVLQLI